MNFDHVYLTTKGYEAFGSGIIGQKTVTWNECKTYSTDISNWEQTAINNATASSFDSVNQTSIGQVTSTSYVSTNEGNSVRIAITLRNTNNSGVLTYHGLARTLCVFGNVNGSSQLLIIAASDEPDTIPQNSEFKAFVDCYIVLSQDTISTINAPNSWYATANDLNTLKDRVVTTHTEGNITQGESQTIYGEKTFISQMTTAAIKPRSNNTYNLGNDSYRWNTIYSQDGNFYNDVIVYNDLIVTGESRLNEANIGTLAITNDVYPDTDGVDIGNSTNKFARLYSTGGSSRNPQSYIVIDSLPSTSNYTTIRPDTDGTCYLGAQDYRWQTAYINTIYVKTAAYISDTAFHVGTSSTAQTLKDYIVSKIQTNSSSSANKWTTARDFTIKDQASPPNVGITKQVDGSDNIDLILPPTIKATLKGKADEAKKADKLTAPAAIDGVKFDGSINISHFCECTTPANTVAKTVTLNNFTIVHGSVVTVRFTYSNSVSNPTLNVNNTGDYPIYLRSGIRAGSTSSSSWRSGDIINFVFYNNGWRKLNNSLRSYVNITDEDKAYPIVFKTYSNIDSTLYSGDASLYTAKTNNFYYNPSTSTLTCENFKGWLSGTADHAWSAAFVGGGDLIVAGAYPSINNVLCLSPVRVDVTTYGTQRDLGSPEDPWDNAYINTINCVNLNLHWVLLTIYYSTAALNEWHILRGTDTGKSIKNSQNYEWHVQAYSSYRQSGNTKEFTIKKYSDDICYVAISNRSSAITSTPSTAQENFPYEENILKDMSMTFLTNVRLPTGNAETTVYVKALVLIH